MFHRHPSPAAVSALFAPDDLRLAALLLDYQVLTLEEISSALTAHAQSHSTFEELLAQRYSINLDQVKGLGTEPTSRSQTWSSLWPLLLGHLQGEGSPVPCPDLSPPRPGYGRVRLGEILVYRQFITSEQLAWALAHQTLSGQPLGEILVAQGWLTPAQLDDHLQAQAWINGAAAMVLSILLAIALEANPLLANPIAGGRRSQGQVQFGAHVPEQVMVNAVGLELMVQTNTADPSRAPALAISQSAQGMYTVTAP